VSISGFPMSLFDRLAFSIPAFSVTPVEYIGNAVAPSNE